MAFFDFINSFVEDNEKEIKAAADGAAAVWSIGSKLAGIAADMAVDTAKEAYASLTEQQPEPEDEEENYLSDVEVYENATQREVVVKLAGYGEAYTVQAINYLLNKYPSGANLPWVKVDQEERCVTILRPEGGFTYIGDDTVEELL